MKKFLATLTLLFTVGFATAQTIPGETNPNVTQENIHSTVCVPGFSKTIRPPASYTNRLKVKQIKELHLSGSPRDYEEDHLIPLSIGGHPTSPSNLWPQPWVGERNAHMKDKLEFKFYKMVCAGEISLQDAQRQISDDWYSAYLRYVEVK